MSARVTIRTSVPLQPVLDASRAGIRRPSARLTLLAVVVWIETMAARRRSRRALLELTDEQLKDIGLSRVDAEREGVRPMWS